MYKTLQHIKNIFGMSKKGNIADSTVSLGLSFVIGGVIMGVGAYFLSSLLNNTTIFPSTSIAYAIVNSTLTLLNTIVGWWPLLLTIFILILVVGYLLYLRQRSGMGGGM